MGWFASKRYTVTTQDLDLMLRLGEFKASVEHIVAENDRLKKENAELRAEVQRCHLLHEKWRTEPAKSLVADSVSEPGSMEQRCPATPPHTEP